MSSAVPALDFGSMTQVIQFLMEIDKLKGVQRRTKVLGTQRRKTPPNTVGTSPSPP